MTPQETVALLALASAVFPQHQVAAETAAVYADLLADLPAEPAMQAMRTLLATQDRWPTVAAIRAEVARQAGALALSPGEAWEAVRAAIRAGTTSGLDPMAKKAADQIGWTDLRQTHNQETTRAHFWRVYGEIAERHDRDALATPGGIQIAVTARRRLAIEAEKDLVELVDEPAPEPADPAVAQQAIAKIRADIARMTRRDADAGLVAKENA